MKNWKNFVADQVINTEEYYLTVPTQYEIFSFRMRYVKHNGYTLLLPVDENKELTEFGKLFMDWFKYNSVYNTRYDKPFWWKPVRFNRKKKLVIWALMSIEKAYSEFKQQMIDKPING